MSWNNICIEGFCFGERIHNKYPCGNTYPTTFCLKNGICPHLGYGETTERDVATFVPFYLILKDRIAAWAEDFYWTIRSLLWDSLWFNRIKVDEFFNSLKKTSRPDTYEVDQMLADNAEAFKTWIVEANKDDE